MLLVLIVVAAACQSAAPQSTPTATTDFQLVRRYASVEIAACTLTYEGEKSTTIRVAAGGMATASEVGQGVNIYFRLNGGDDEFEFDGVAAKEWRQLTLDTSRGRPGRPLARGMGEPDRTEWSGIWERVAEAHVESLHGDLFVTRHDLNDPSTVIFASASFDCPDGGEDSRRA